MHPLLIISIVVLIIGIAALVILLGVAVPSLLKTMKIVNAHADEMKKRVDPIMKQKDLLLPQVEKMKQDVQWKVDSVKDTVQTVKGTGETVKQLQFSTQRKTSALIRKISNSKETQDKTEQYSEMAMGFLNRKKQKK